MNKRYDPTIMATGVIPWDEHECFIPTLFEEQIQHMIDNGIQHIYLFGTAGEGYGISFKQFQSIVTHFASIMEPKHLFPMVGIIAHSNQQIKERLEFCYDLGIRDFQITLPCWKPLCWNEILIFMDDILNTYQDCRFMLYNALHTRRMLEINELFEIEKQYPNFVAVKQTHLTAKDVQKIASSKTELQFFVTEKNYATLSKKTQAGLILTIGHLDYKESIDFFHHCKIQPDHHHGFLDTYSMILTYLQNMRTNQPIDGAYDKMYVKYYLPDFPLRLLKPYQYFSNQDFEALKKFIHSVIDKK